MDAYRQRSVIEFIMIELMTEGKKKKKNVHFKTLSQPEFFFKDAPCGELSNFTDINIQNGLNRPQDAPI